MIIEQKIMKSGFKLNNITFRMREGDKAGNANECAIGGKWVDKTTDDFFKGIMTRGGWWNINKKSSGPKNPKINITNVVSDVKRSNNSFHLIPFKSHVFGDGNSLANPWAQGSPDPLTSITWDSWIEINTKTAEGLKIKAGDILKVTSNSGSIELPAYLHPAVPSNSVSIPIGLGKQNFTRYASGRGSNIVELIDTSKLNEDGNISWNSTSVLIEKTSLSISGGHTTGITSRSYFRAKSKSL